MRSGLAILGLLLLIACSQPATRTAPSGFDEDRPESGTIFRHRWWNYYTRALESMDDEKLDAAVADLHRALQHRDRDQRMARTYGMHFLDYFPHRELGVVHWLRGELALAAAELSLSIQQAPSAKARYYQDQVRKARIEKSSVPVQPPQLTLVEPPDGYWSAADRIAVRGRATDSNFVRHIRIDGQPLYLEGGRLAVDFSHELSLPQGCHFINVEAINLVGMGTQRQFLVCMDRVGPLVVLDRIEQRGNGLFISGTALDAAGVATIDINDRSIPAAGQSEMDFSLLLTASPPHIVIECRDVLGNRTTFRSDIAHLQTVLCNPRWLASRQLAGLFQRGDDEPPVLQVQDWQEHQTVFMDKVVITGSVRDQEMVSELSINGQSLLPQPGALFFFSHIVDLSPGNNTVTVVATDAHGNRSHRRITIECRRPKCLLLEERMRLSIFAFEQKGHVSAAGFAFQDDFIHEIVRHKRFQIVERRRLDLILEEQKISQTRLIDSGTAVRLGNLAAAQAIVTGSLVQTRTGIEIVGRVVDTETAEILCVTDVYGENQSLQGLKTLAQALALKLNREFPLVDGLVIDKKGDIITTDLTLEKLRAQRRILVYAEQPVVHPETNQSMGMDHEVLGGARVTQVDDHLAKARLKSGSHSSIQPLHRVITQ